MSGEHPILFSAPMVRALLAGRKTQTRRVLPARHPRCPQHCHIRLDVMAPEENAIWYWDGKHDRVGASLPLRFARGDRLWVRETWRSVGHLDSHSGKQMAAACLDAGYPKPWAPIEYQADGSRDNWIDDYGSGPGRLRASIHMPRWASRLTLLVTDVRVQRLQDVSAEDAQAEGVEPFGDGSAFVRLQGAQTYSTVRGCFAALWDSINGADAWAANPWVVAVTFTVERRNIDR